MIAVVCTQPRTYALYRPDFLTAVFAAGKASGAKAMLPWSLVAWTVDASDSGGFGFGPDDPSFAPVASAIAYQKSQARLPAHCLLKSCRHGRRHKGGHVPG